MIRESQCVYCTHLMGAYKNGRRCCAAFPYGIPKEVQSSEFDHRLPHPADNGLRYEPKDPRDDFYEGIALPKGELEVSAA